MTVAEIDTPEVRVVATEPWRLEPHTFAEKMSEHSERQWKAWPHLKLISERIASAIVRGRGRLIVSMPPGHGKSSLISQWTPVWYLDNLPAQRVILASHGAEMAQTWGRTVRNEFENNPGLTTKLSEDSKAADRWNTPQGGGMKTVGVAGGITGFRGNLILIDDPHPTWEDAMSIVHREHVIEWFDGTLYDRCEPGATIILLMHRWHEDDLAGYLIEKHKDPWEVISLPALARIGDPLGRKVGETLCPQRFPQAEMDETHRVTPAHIWAAKFDQNPKGVGAGRVYDRFDQSKHEDKTLAIRDGLPIDISFDFNRNPGMHVEIGQYDPGKDLFTCVHEIHGPFMKLDAALVATEELLNKLKMPNALLRIFGDATGTQERAETTDTCYQKIDNWLKLINHRSRKFVPASNPPVSERIDSFNEALVDAGGDVHYKFHPGNCPRLKEDLKNLKSDEQGLIDKRNMKLSHACLVAGTMVTTIGGNVPIEDVRVGDRVLTRVGWRRISHAWMSHPNADVLTMYTSDGKHLTGTGNHPIWIENDGFCLLEDVKSGDVVDIIRYPSTSENQCEQRPSFIRASHIPDTQIRNAASSAYISCERHADARSGGSIRSSMKTITGQFQQGGTSTIKTKIRSTTTPATLNRWSVQNTPDYTQALRSISQKLCSPSLPQERPPRFGMPAMTAGSGTGSTPSRPDSGITTSSRIATIAERNSSTSKGGERTSFVRGIVRPAQGGQVASTMKREFASCAAPRSPLIDIGKTNVVPVHVVGVFAERKTQPVYDLTVEDAHEFYANGILVSNSDAEGYRVHQVRPIVKGVKVPKQFSVYMGSGN